MSFEPYGNAYKHVGLICKKQPPHTAMPNRRIITGIRDQATCDNQIITCKYNAFTFIPLNLKQQFSKLANVYFLIIGIMQLLPGISISNGVPVIYLPLLIIVVVAALKDLAEDRARARSDEHVNFSQCSRLINGVKVNVLWKDIKIGDLVYLVKDEAVPADLLILQTSEENNSLFVETKNLDGQTNLKFKQAKYCVAQAFQVYRLQLKEQDFQGICSKKAQFNYQRPNPYIHSFSGSFQGDALDSGNVALRGSSMKITDWAIGVVIYAGVDTKVMLNSSASREKKSRLEVLTSNAVLVIFLIQMILTLWAGSLSIIYLHDDFLQQKTHELFIVIMLRRWGSWVLLFTAFVPISLVLTLESTKYLQGKLISTHKYQTQEPSEVIVQTSSLNEQLGQIQYMCCDKTGTLTKNQMNFKYLVIGTSSYGEDTDSEAINHFPNVDFHDKQFIKKLKDVNALSEDETEMMCALALCHNIIIEKDREQIKYNASSPDELAFINMARLCGWVYEGVNAHNQMCVRLHGKQLLKYKVLNIIEFDSDRKRMSVMIERGSEVVVYCKGADNIILDRLRRDNFDEIMSTREKVLRWSQLGLRTLLFSYRKIPRKDYDSWAKMYAFALTSLALEEDQKTKAIKAQRDQQLKSRKKISDSGIQNFKRRFSFLRKSPITEQEMRSDAILTQPERLMNSLINDRKLITERQLSFIQGYVNEVERCDLTVGELQNIIEKELKLLGATAIEDKLQDNVKITLEKLRKAGIRVCMLTGDKKQTAINIGYSCGLITEGMAVIEWQGNVAATETHRNNQPEYKQCCLVIEGSQLLNQPDEFALISLVLSCKSLICCRVTPKQKEQMVRLIRKRDYITIAIGDGANDVNMINAAHVGIGIKGNEGAQAAMCADYAISEFQILGELLLYHGRECYRRNAILVQYTFNKNLLLVLPQLWFGFINRFASTTIYENWINQLYNIFFTALPIVIYALFDQQFSVKQCFEHPQVYEAGRLSKLFSRSTIIKNFGFTLLATLWLAIINFIVLDRYIDGGHNGPDLVTSGMTLFAQVVIISNVRVIVVSFNKSIALLLSCALGITMYYVSIVLEPYIISNTDITNCFKNETVSPFYWTALITGSLSILLIDIFTEVQAPITRHFEQPQQKNQDVNLQGSMSPLPTIANIDS